jgi:hypothetical protein
MTFDQWWEVLEESGFRTYRQAAHDAWNAARIDALEHARELIDAELKIQEDQSLDGAYGLAKASGIIYGVIAAAGAK